MSESKLDALKFEIQEEASAGTRIKVIGVGSGGSNAVARLMDAGISGVDFYAVDTDRQSLMAAPAPNKLAIGAKVTNGLGAGADVNVGREAALEDTERIIEILDGADMVFVTAGLGGGTGTGAAPVVASLAKELNALTVAVVTRPFAFEGSRRMKVAEKGLADLKATVDTVIAIRNDRLLELVPRGSSIVDAFRVADEVLRQAVEGISDIMITPGMLNRDFADIRAIMVGMGHAMMGSATARGENAAVEAARKAIRFPLLEDGELVGARGILINITGSTKLGLHDINDACQLIRQAAGHEDVQVNFGLSLNDSMGEAVKVTVIATGFEAARASVGEPKRLAAVMSSIPEPVDMALPEPAQPEPLAFDREPEPEPVHSMAATATNGPVHIPIAIDESAPMDDLDTPAFLRRDRRQIQ
jgi:cell division protein FtsZ